jgi:hypothetical protein
LLASTPGEWVGALVNLVDDASLRARLGVAGRRTVEERYSMRRSAHALAKVVHDEVDRAAHYAEARA